MLKRFGLALRIGLCLSASTYALAAETFHVLSYNVENLWDDEPDNTNVVWRKFLDSLSPDDRDSVGNRPLQYKDYAIDTSNWYSPEVLDAKIRHLVEVIKLAGEPEILALQEIESAGNESHVFDMHGSKLVLREEFEKMGYHYFILGAQNKKNPVAVTQAIISKLKVTEAPSVNIEFEDEPFSTSARDIQVVEYKEGENRMLIFNNHWKSKMGGRKTEKTRIQIAKTLKRRIEEERKSNPETRVIVLGDLNSSYTEDPILVLASGDESTMLRDKTSNLYNTWYEVPEDDRWETSYRGERQTLSAVLISDEFYLKNGIQYIDQSFHVVGQTGKPARKLLNSDGTPFRWQTRKREDFTVHVGKGYSDHLPLVLSFRIAKSSDNKSKISLSHKSDSGKILQGSKLDKVPLCTEAETVSMSDVNFDSENWFQQCVRIEGDYTLLGNSLHENNYIQFQNINIFLAMTRSWDETPNVDDSRVGFVRDLRNYNRSNKCFHRKVLRGEGGVLKKAVGRLGYDEGNIAVFIPTRQEKDIVLSGLPEFKQAACPWN